MAAVSKIEQGVVELRTDVGRLYVCPRGWQRLYLRWTFRNFHSLPQQILNRRQKRLIENLSRSAILTPSERVPTSAVIGIVENMTVLALPSTSELAEAAKTVKPAAADAHLAVLQGRAEDQVVGSSAAMSIAEAPAERAAALRPVVPEISQDRSVQPLAKEPVEISGHAPEPEHRTGTERRKRNSWAVALAGVGTAVLLLAYWLVPLVRSPQLSVAPAPMPQAPLLPVAEKPAAPAAVVPVKATAQPARLALQTLHGVAATAVTGQPVTKRTASDAAERANAAAVLNAAPLPQIEEAPRSGFVYPVTPNPNLVGKVVLKAVVGSDGTVKQVEVLSGDRALALAAVRAVRQWRYAPPQVDGRTVDAETRVTISFLGDDAVSIILPNPQ